MKEYREMYASRTVKLYGAYEDYGAYVFRVELDGCLISGLHYEFSGTALFYLSTNKEEYCKKMESMYDTLHGECLIQDCEFGNELKFYFVGRQLKIEGKFDDGDKFLRFSGDVDQTIIPRVISLLRNE